MSTKPLVRRRTGLREAGVLLVATCVKTAVNAADVDFRPVMTFGVFHSGNVSVIGGKHGDEGAALSFDLAFDRKMPMSTFTFSYRPSYVAYRRSSDLDYFGNTLVVGFVRESSRASRFTMDAHVSRTDYQGQTRDTADSATTFVPRTTLSQANFRVGGTVGAGRRGFVDLQLRGGADRYKDVTDDPETPTVDESYDFTDSTDLGGRIAWRDELSVRNTLGLGLDVAHFEFEARPSVVVESLGLVGTCHAGPSWMLDYAAGASRATSDGDSIDGFSFNATIEYAAGKASTFGAGARQVFAPGTGLGAATQDRGVWISYSHAPSARGLSGSAVGGYWQRDELQFASSTPSADSATFTVSGSMGWNFNRHLALDVSYVFIDQSARNVTDPLLASSLDTKYSSYGLFLRWAIRGR